MQEVVLVNTKDALILADSDRILRQLIGLAFSFLLQEKTSRHKRFIA